MAECDPAMRRQAHPSAPVVLIEDGHGGAVSREVLGRPGWPAGCRGAHATLLGQHLGAVGAVLVSALNPSLILLDAGLLTAGDPFMVAFRKAVVERSLPSATTKLEFAISTLGNSAGLVGAAYIVVDELLSPQHLKLWSEHGTPAGRADLIHQNSHERP